MKKFLRPLALVSLHSLMFVAVCVAFVLFVAGTDNPAFQRNVEQS